MVSLVFCSLLLLDIDVVMYGWHLQVDEDISVGVEGFSRIASAVPIIANAIISENLFEVLTKSTGGRIQFYVYEKYLSGLDRLFHVLTVCNYSTLSFSYQKKKKEDSYLVHKTLTFVGFGRGKW